MGRKEKWRGLFPPRLEHFTDVWPDKQDATCGTSDRLEGRNQAALKGTTTAGLQVLEEMWQHPGRAGDALNSLIPEEKSGKIPKRK